MAQDDDNYAGAFRAKPGRLMLKGGEGRFTFTTSSAVSSVDSLAPYITDGPIAQSIKIEIQGLDHHDLTALKHGNLPDHVSIPEGDKTRALARSYAEAELTDREKRSDWFKSWIGWAVTILAVIAATVITWIFKPDG